MIEAVVLTTHSETSWWNSSFFHEKKYFPSGWEQETECFIASYFCI